MWFTSIASAAEVASPEVVEERTAPPWYVLLPLGGAQFAQGRPAEATWFAVLQGGLATGSVAVALDLRRRTPVVMPSREELRTLRLEQYGVQWPLTAAFWGAWVGSTLEACAWDRDRRRVDSRWVVTPTAGEVVGLQASGAF